MQLWLQGPQSLEVLGELATRFATGLAAGEAPPPAPPLVWASPLNCSWPSPASPRCGAAR
jgi:hypothetical protein